MLIPNSDRSVLQAGRCVRVSKVSRSTSYLRQTPRSKQPPFCWTTSKTCLCRWDQAALPRSDRVTGILPQGYCPRDTAPSLLSTDRSDLNNLLLIFIITLFTVYLILLLFYLFILNLIFLLFYYCYYFIYYFNIIYNSIWFELIFREQILLRCTRYRLL